MNRKEFFQKLGMAIPALAIANEVVMDEITKSRALRLRKLDKKSGKKAKVMKWVIKDTITTVRYNLKKLIARKER